MESLPSGSDAVRSYLADDLFPLVIAPLCPEKINLQASFKQYLKRIGYPSLIADEKAERWHVDLTQKLISRLDNWTALGLPAPMDFCIDYGRSLLTWQHANYKKITGRIPLPKEFAKIDQWIAAKNSRDFLFVCACYLVVMGADIIFITDNTGDGGIDLVGRVDKGPAHSICYFVQAKTSTSLISRESVLAEHGKYLATRQSDIFAKYRKALGIDKAADGMSYCYIFAANHEFNASVRNDAQLLGVLLRSRFQMSCWLSEHTTFAKLQAAESVLNGNLSADLDRNLARLINL